jgi:hypothetical protein
VSIGFAADDLPERVSAEVFEGVAGHEDERLDLEEGMRADMDEAMAIPVKFFANEEAALLASRRRKK